MMKWIEMLRGQVAEEQDDYDKYMDIAAQAEMEGCFHEAGVLRDIAHDEESHKHLVSELVGEEKSRW